LDAQQHPMIDETIEMADAATPENWQVVKPRIWALPWRGAKLAPRVYGDEVEVAARRRGCALLRAPRASTPSASSTRTFAQPLRGWGH
jgi:hypothetical protein